MNDRLSQAALMLAIVCLFAGCASAPPPPIPMTCVVSATKDVNPTAAGRPSPLLVRIYALKSAAAFTNADFIAIYQREQTELATDIAGKDDMTLAPGESKPCSKVLPPETRFLGVVGIFRDVEHATWRAIAPIEGGKKATVTIRADALSVDIAVAR